MSTAYLVREKPARWIGDVAPEVRAGGLRPVLVTEPLPDAEHTELADVVDEFLYVKDIYDADGIAAVIREHAGDARPAGLLTLAEGVVGSTARAAELLGVDRCPADALVLAHNKFAVREVLAAAGLPGPGHALISDPAQAAAVAEQVGLPAIVKPVNGAASKLVRTVSTVEELAAACSLLAERLPQSTDPRYQRPITGVAGTEPIHPSKTFLVEGLLRGRELSLDVSICDGVVHAAELVDKPLIDERKFELGMCCPPMDLDDERAEVLKAAVARAVLALGLDNTVAHVEVIDDETRGPTIVEINAGRAAGGAQGVLIKSATGVDVVAEAVAAAMGTPRPARGAGFPIPIGYLVCYAEGTGRLVRVTGVEDIEDLPEVLQVVTIVNPGDVLTDEHEIYAVNVIVAGFADYDDLAAIHAEAAKLLAFELEDVR